MSAVPFKANADRRHHIPKQQDRVTNWSEYDAGLRQRGSLTVWFSEEAIAAWRAEPRTTRGGQRHYSALADHNGTDLAHGVPLASAADRGTDRVRHPLARSRSRRARPFDAEPASRDIGSGATAIQRRAHTSVGGQHRAKALRRR